MEWFVFSRKNISNDVTAADTNQMRIAFSVMSDELIINFAKRTATPDAKTEAHKSIASINFALKYLSRCNFVASFLIMEQS